MMACSANLRLQTLYFTVPELEVLDGHGTSGGVVAREVTDPLRSAMDDQRGNGDIADFNRGSRMHRQLAVQCPDQQIEERYPRWLDSYQQLLRWLTIEC
jgi:hypothetical protein